MSSKIIIIFACETPEFISVDTWLKNITIQFSIAYIMWCRIFENSYNFSIVHGSSAGEMSKIYIRRSCNFKNQVLALFWFTMYMIVTLIGKQWSNGLVSVCLSVCLSCLGFHITASLKFAHDCEAARLCIQSCNWLVDQSCRRPTASSTRPSYVLVLMF